ncbi:TetR/AcrR family transcriptional regulator [Phenylobacterium sp.]|uniref:TetR/AcrR family transcriptional regulator n=1 Tax=Phenylobacterium sp. TaxID=1871053 RepID=UPI00273180DA|nr:TetR/AcrR family transcriptional regulator [Phenylobacterium sp.]MDP1618975.1 TetR/AcrR family transcriptional regulator [Phenylobacterium sp.]MDP1989309.1 TetR/AcrR family transcriptional regulator [Phenylobacterium sp.]
MGTTATTSAVLARRRSYHVGNVRSQLSAAASALLESEGASALSLRAIARRTGVALGTVYYHYADKHALLAGLAVEGFRDLAEALHAAADARGEMSSLRASGMAYLAFVRARPALYGLMYEMRDVGRREEVEEAESAAFAEMIRAVGQDFKPGSDPDAIRQVAQAIWACARGVAALALARGGPGRLDSETVREAVLGLEILVSRR